MSYRVAFISSTSPLKITYPGDSGKLPAFCNGTYTPVLNDPVAVVALDATKLLVVCPLVPSTGPSTTPHAQNVYVPGSDGSVWQITATAAGTLQTTKVG